MFAKIRQIHVIKFTANLFAACLIISVISLCADLL